MIRENVIIHMVEKCTNFAEGCAVTAHIVQNITFNSDVFKLEIQAFQAKLELKIKLFHLREVFLSFKSFSVSLNSLILSLNSLIFEL